MANILTDALPTMVQINNMKYDINSDFRTSIVFSNIINTEDLTEEVIFKILNLYYPVIPADVEKAINEIFLFYIAEEEKTERTKKSGNNKRIFDYEEDSKYIYSAFLSQYGIDLQSIQYLHWWKFKAMFISLKEDNEIVKIMQYRSMDLSKIQDKEQKKFYKKMKELYKLKERINEDDKKALDDVRKLLK